MCEDAEVQLGFLRNSCPDRSIAVDAVNSEVAGIVVAREPKNCRGLWRWAVNLDSRRASELSAKADWVLRLRNAHQAMEGSRQNCDAAIAKLRF